MSKEDDAASRAEIPPMMSQVQRDALVYTPKCRQRRGNQQVECVASLQAEDIEEFLAEFAWLKETEVALQCLFDGGFDLPKAVQLLHAARRERHRRLGDQDEQFVSEALQTAIEIHGKRFHIVKQALGQRATTREAVSEYYLWKRTLEFRNWRRTQTAKESKKKKNEIERLRLGNKPDVDSEANVFQGYHSKQCELCATGGKLLCCDGCPRAYHFSCVQPPIIKRPNEWFCLYCQKVFGSAKPKMIPSQDNEYCQVCLPFEGVPRLLMGSMMNNSSQEEDDKLEGNAHIDNDSDAALQQNDEISDYDAMSSELSSIDETISTTGSPGSLRDGKPVTTNAIALLFQSEAASIKSRKQDQKPASVVASSVHKQQSGAAVQSNYGSSQVTSNDLVKRFVEANPAEMRMAFVQLKKAAASGRKRHRKTMTPRRIPPSQFDNPS